MHCVCVCAYLCVVYTLCLYFQQRLPGARSGGISEGITGLSHISVHHSLWKYSDWQVSHFTPIFFHCTCKKMSFDFLTSLSIMTSENVLKDRSVMWLVYLPPCCGMWKHPHWHINQKRTSARAGLLLLSICFGLTDLPLLKSQWYQSSWDYATLSYRMEMVVAFSLLARIVGECMTSHSPLALFLFAFLSGN